jgi:hypothetical protein
LDLRGWSLEPKEHAKAKALLERAIGAEKKFEFLKEEKRK